MPLGGAATSCSSGRGRRCCAGSTATTSATARRTGAGSPGATSPATARKRTRTDTSGPRPRRRRHERRRPPALDDRGRERAGLASEGRRGCGRRPRGPSRGRRSSRSSRCAGASSAATRSSKELREHVVTQDRRDRATRRDHVHAELPKTRSGKIMRRLLRDIAERARPRRHHDARRFHRRRDDPCITGKEE